MSRSGWLVAIALAGIAIFALSFANGWIAHDREVRGEGYRYVHISLSAWRAVAVPVLSAGALTALGTATGAVIGLRRPNIIPGWLLLGAAVLTLVLIASSIVPIGQDGHASSVDLTVDRLTGIGVGLACLMVVGAASVVRPNRRLVMVIGVLSVAAFAGAAGGRWLGLQRQEGTGQHWSEGSYVRAASASEQRETLTIHDGRFAIGERWAGTWESSGWTVVLADDPACPDARGTYHAHGEGDAGVDLRFVKVVDTCLGGARTAVLETGIWIREP